MRMRNSIGFLLALTLTTHALAQLPANTTRQIQLLLNEKSARTPVQKKMDSRLLQFVREKRGEKMVAGVDLETIKLDVNDKGTIEVDIQGDVDDNLLSKIEAMGGRVVAASSEFHSLRAQIIPNTAEKIAALSQV